MPSILTDEERAAITAFPDDKVQKIPTGKSVDENAWIWSEKFQKLVRADGKTGPELRREYGQKFWRARIKNRKHTPDPAIVARRQRIAEMVRCGMNGTQIARALDIPVTTVHTDVRHMSGVSLKKDNSQRDADVLARIRAGETSRGIYAATGVSRETIARIAKVNGVSIKGPYADVRDKIRKAWRPGISTAEMCRATGFTKTTIRSHLTALNLGPVRNKASIAERQRQVVAMWKKGVPAPDIAKKFGLNAGYVRKLIIKARKAGA